MDKGALQENQYTFPYHHIPRFGERFSQARIMFWGYEFVSYLERVLELLEHMEFESLIDIGCGDGRFVHEIVKRYPSKKLLGVDYSERSLGFARAFTPNVRFLTSTNERFDAFILTEVIEHIDPLEMDSFLDRICENLLPGARGIFTTPSDNIPTHPKHYRHFSEATLREALEKHFYIESIEFVNAETFGVAVIKRLLANHFFALTHQGLLNYIYRIYKRRYLPATTKNGGRIIAVARMR